MKKVKYILLIALFIYSWKGNCQEDEHAAECFIDYNLCTIDAEIFFLGPLSFIELSPDVQARQRQGFIDAMRVCAGNYFACRG